MSTKARIPLGTKFLNPRVISRTFSTTPRLVDRAANAPKKEKGKPLYASIASHRAAIYIHAPRPPMDFPAKLSTPLQRALQLKVTRWGGIVNFSWLGPQHAPQPPMDFPVKLKATRWGGIVNFSWLGPQRTPHASDSATSASVTAFSPLGGRLEIPELSLANIDEVEERLRVHATEGPVVPGTEDEIHLYVCTHGARDCRCGDMGSAVAAALREEVKKAVEWDPQGPASRVKIGEVGHVGGHQFAANLLVYPHGEWLGLITPSDVPEVLKRILATKVAPLPNDAPPLLVEHWRGRAGLGKEEQLDLYAAYSSK